MSWRTMFGCFIALSCTHADAQNVYKCVAAGGVVSYQSAPCEHGARETARWDAPPDPPSRLHQSVANPERHASEPRFTRTGSAHIARNAVKPSACEAAKANRDRTLERVGLKRTFDLLSRLDEQVRNACR